jgi:hypothetical protein
MNQYELLNLEFVLKQIRFKELLSKDEINGFLLRFNSERNLQQYSIERSTIEYEIRSTINELETLLQFYFFNETSKKALDEIIVENKINEDWYTRHNWILNELMLEFIYFTEKTPIIQNLQVSQIKKDENDTVTEEVFEINDESEIVSVDYNGKKTKFNTFLKNL